MQGLKTKTFKEAIERKESKILKLVGLIQIPKEVGYNEIFKWTKDISWVEEGMVQLLNYLKKRRVVGGK